MTEAEKTYDWDDQVAIDPDAGPDFRILEPGYYPFEVTGFSRERYKGSAKMTACAMAKLTLRVTDALGTATVFERLYLAEKSMWKVAAFMEAIGCDRNADGKIVPDWNRVDGAQGWLKLKKRTYESQGETKVVNDVDHFCKASEKPQAEAAYMQQCQASQPAAAQAAPSYAPQTQSAPSYSPQVQQTAPVPAQQQHAPQTVQQAMPGMPMPQPVQGGVAHPGWSMV